jgi:hypothetical protein
MRWLSGCLVSALCFVALLFPFSALAFTPMGGLVVFMRPCNTGYLITVVNPGVIGSGEFMWTPGTISFLYGPPVLHEWVLGTTDVPLPCFVGPVLYGFGQRITFMGTSLPLPAGSESSGANAVINGHGLY